MAQNLTAFLAQNAAKIETRKYVASPRFTDPETGAPMEWEIGCITGKENSEIRTRSTHTVRMGRSYSQEFDSGVYMAKLCARCTIFPNLNDSELQSSYGVMNAEDLIQTMLSPGELYDYFVAVMDANGFTDDTENPVAEAKNS